MMLRRALVTLGIAVGLGAMLIVAGHFRFGSVKNCLAYLSGQRLVVDAAVKSHGLVKPGNQLSMDFYIYNFSSDNIKIVGSSSSCTCTVTDSLPLAIPPWSSRVVRVRTATAGKHGKFTEEMKLFTNSSSESEMALYVTGQVQGGQAP
jgi:Protein of unknown function (DUF1573)